MLKQISLCNFVKASLSSQFIHATHTYINSLDLHLNLKCLLVRHLRQDKMVSFICALVAITCIVVNIQG